MLETILLATLPLNYSARPVPPLNTLHPVRRELILKQDGYPRYRRGYRGLPYYPHPAQTPPQRRETKPADKYAPDLEECTCPPNVQCIKC